jgi:hypothetical protein
LRDILEDKLRVQWMKKINDALSIGSKKTEDLPITIPALRVTSWRDSFFYRLELDLKFGVLSLLLYAATTLFPLWLLSLVFEIPYRALAYLLLIPAVMTVYFAVDPLGFSSCGQMILYYLLPVGGSFYWLFSSTGPTFKTVVLLWIFTTLYRSYMNRLALLLVFKVKMFDAFEREYLMMWRL